MLDIVRWQVARDLVSGICCAGNTHNREATARFGSRRQVVVSKLHKGTNGEEEKELVRKQQ